jgi:hypothetical protein
MNLPYTMMLLIAHPLLRRVYNSVFPAPSSSKAGAEAADARLNQRASFDYAFALIFLAALHGFSAVKVLTILYMNYQLAMNLPRKYLPVASWVFNIAILFANELCSGYHFRDIAGLVSKPPASIASDEPMLLRLGGWLDSYGGLMPRWEILFNITILRLISFNMDYYWSADGRAASSIEVLSLVMREQRM